MNFSDFQLRTYFPLKKKRVEGTDKIALFKALVYLSFRKFKRNFTKKQIKSDVKTELYTTFSCMIHSTELKMFSDLYDTIFSVFQKEHVITPTSYQTVEYSRKLREKNNFDPSKKKKKVMGYDLIFLYPKKYTNSLFRNNVLLQSLIILEKLKRNESIIDIAINGFFCDMLPLCHFIQQTQLSMYRKRYALFHHCVVNTIPPKKRLRRACSQIKCQNDHFITLIHHLMFGSTVHLDVFEVPKNDEKSKSIFFDSRRLFTDNDVEDDVQMMTSSNEESQKKTIDLSILHDKKNENKINENRNVDVDMDMDSEQYKSHKEIVNEVKNDDGIDISELTMFDNLEVVFDIFTVREISEMIEKYTSLEKNSTKVPVMSELDKILFDEYHFIEKETESNSNNENSKNNNENSLSIENDENNDIDIDIDMKDSDVFEKNEKNEKNISKEKIDKILTIKSNKKKVSKMDNEISTWLENEQEEEMNSNIMDIENEDVIITSLKDMKIPKKKKQEVTSESLKIEDKSISYNISDKTEHIEDVIMEDDNIARKNIKRNVFRNIFQNDFENKLFTKDDDDEEDEEEEEEEDTNGGIDFENEFKEFKLKEDELIDPKEEEERKKREREYFQKVLRNAQEKVIQKRIKEEKERRLNRKRRRNNKLSSRRIDVTIYEREDKQLRKYHDGFCIDKIEDYGGSIYIVRTWHEYFFQRKYIAPNIEVHLDRVVPEVKYLRQELMDRIIVGKVLRCFDGRKYVYYSGKKTERRLFYSTGIYWRLIALHKLDERKWTEDQIFYVLMTFFEQLIEFFIAFVKNRLPFPVKRLRLIDFHYSFSTWNDLKLYYLVPVDYKEKYVHIYNEKIVMNDILNILRAFAGAQLLIKRLPNFMYQFRLENMLEILGPEKKKVEKLILEEEVFQFLVFGKVRNI